MAPAVSANGYDAVTGEREAALVAVHSTCPTFLSVRRQGQLEETLVCWHHSRCCLREGDLEADCL